MDGRTDGRSDGGKLDNDDGVDTPLIGDMISLGLNLCANNERAELMDLLVSFFLLASNSLTF